MASTSSLCDSGRVSEDRDDRVLQLEDEVFDALTGDLVLLCCVLWSGEEGVSGDSKEEEGLVEDLVDLDESLVELEEELLFVESLVDLDEEDEEEEDLLESLKDLVEGRLSSDEASKLCGSFLPLEGRLDEAERRGSGLVSSASSPTTSSTVTKSFMLKFCSVQS